jgi:hypothetical protein
MNTLEKEIILNELLSIKNNMGNEIIIPLKKVTMLKVD